MPKKVQPRRRDLLLAATASALCPAWSQTSAGRYPTKPIRLVVGFAAGGGTDVMARTVGQRMSELLAQPLVIDNKPGANGNIAAETVSKAAADGYTLMYNTSALVISPGLYAKTGYSVPSDFTAVGGATNVAIALVVRPSLGVRTASEFVELLKSKPNTLTYASSSNGNITHLAALLFLRATGTAAMHVPYRSETPAMTDVIGGQVDFMLATVPGVLPFVNSKRLVALGVGTNRPLSVLPNVPTFDETVAKGLEIGAWSGIVGPAGVSPEQVAVLNQALAEALRDKSVLATMAAQGAIAQYSSPSDYRTYLQSELSKWSRVIRDNNVRID